MCDRFQASIVTFIICIFFILGAYPENAVKGGFEEDAPLYIARTKAPDGGLCIGVLHPDHGVCYYSWGGEEHKANEYEIMTCT